MATAAAGENTYKIHTHFKVTIFLIVHFSKSTKHIFICFHASIINIVCILFVYSIENKCSYSNKINKWNGMEIKEI